jgi:hypothetical protein
MHRRRLALIQVLAAAVLIGSGAAWPIAGPLPFFYDLYTFRGPAGSTAVVSSFAVEAGRLATRAVDGRKQYRFSLSLVLADTALKRVSNTHDTVYIEVEQPFPDEHLLYTHVEVLAAASTSTWQRVIVIDAITSGVGQLYTEPYPIPDYSGSALMLSDIVLARPGAETGWERGDLILGILPSTRFPPDVFDIYYEIYNLPADHVYVTEIAIEKAEPDGAPEHEPIRLRFSGQSDSGPDGQLSELRQVDASLSRGSYRLTVTVTDRVTGQTATRSRSFVVQDRARDATRVKAYRSRYSGVR